MDAQDAPNSTESDTSSDTYAEDKPPASSSSSTDIDSDTKSVVVVPTLLTLARAYMSDSLPPGWHLYDDQQSSRDVDVEASRAAVFSSQNKPREAWGSYTGIQRPGLQRSDTGLTTASKGPFDEDDPRNTGVATNQDDVNEWIEKFQLEHDYAPKSDDLVEYQLNLGVSHKRHCLLRLGKAFIRFGAPTHRLEGIMKAARQALDVKDARFIFLPGLMIVSFGDGEQGSTDMKLVKTPTRLDLGRLSETYAIYKEVTHSIIGAKEGANKLGALLDKGRKPYWGRWTRCAFGFCTAFLVCPMAFGGSFLDALVAGLLGLFVCMLSLFAAAKSAVFSTVFEIVAVIVVSFVSQGLSRIQGERYFCYSAITTAGVVSLLPGFIVLSSAQELAAKHAMSGSVKMVYAVVYSLFLGFSLDFGSQVWLSFDKSEAALKAQAIRALNPKGILTGTFTRLTNTTIPWETGAFQYEPFRIAVDPLKNHFMIGTCYRSPGLPWYLSPWPWQALFVIVPLYTLASAFWNLQPIRRNRRGDLKQLIAMVLISSAAFAANRLCGRFLAKSDSVTAVGAVVVGLLGNLYSRVFKGYAYPAMVPGVLFLIPSGISSLGGQSYTGRNITLRILQVSIGVTVGLGLSNYVVYTATALLPKRLGGKNAKKEAVFAF